MRGFTAVRGFAERARGFFKLPMVPGWWTPFGDLVLITVFAALASLDALKSFVNWAIGWDALIYTDAARALVAGRDAWGWAGGSALYAAPPPGLLPFFPFLWLPDPLVAAGWTAVAAASGVYVLRKLRLPMWWLAFPPVLVAILAGSTALPVTALLVRGGAIAQGAAAAFRVYAAIPLAILGRWRALGFAAVIVIVTAPFLDWPRFLTHFSSISAALDFQAEGGKSAASVPWLIPVAVACLFLLGRRRAAWLIVPALWPYAQNYYSVLALPVLGGMPLVALSLAVDRVPGLVVVGLLAQVVVDRLAGRKLADWRRPTERSEEDESAGSRQAAIHDPGQVPEGGLLTAPHQQVGGG